MQPYYKHRLFPVLIAVVIALIALIYYIWSGQGSSTLNARIIQSSPAVDKVEIKQASTGQQTAIVKCKDGTDYSVYYPPGSTNYDALAADKCAN